MSTSADIVNSFREKRASLKFGDVLAMCAQCGAVRVENKGDVCLPCVKVLVNRSRMLGDDRATLRAIKHALVISAVLALIVIAAAIYASMQ